MDISIKKILCPVDFSEHSDHALRYAAAFASAYDAELEVFNVLEPPVLPSYSTGGIPDLSQAIERIKQDGQQRLDELVEKLRQSHPRTVGRMVVGTPFVEIIERARGGNFDLIVIGTHGASGLKHVLMGSVAERVVRKAPCPVLSVKHPGHEFVMP
jgi:nucleotide-binding universal stress UspA family protein